MITVNADNYGDIGPFKSVTVRTALSDAITSLETISDHRILAVLSATANSGITASIGDRAIFTGGEPNIAYASSGDTSQGIEHAMYCRSLARNLFDTQCYNPKGDSYKGQSLSSVIQDVIEREGLDPDLFQPRTADQIQINSYQMRHGAGLGSELQNLVEDYYGVFTDNGDGVLGVYDIRDFRDIPEFVIEESETTDFGFGYNSDSRYSRFYGIARPSKNTEARLVGPREVSGQGSRNRVFMFDNDLTDDQIRKALDYAANRSMVSGLSVFAVVSGELLDIQKGQPVSITSRLSDAITEIFNIPDTGWVAESIEWRWDGTTGSSTSVSITPIEQYGYPDLPQRVYQRSVVLGGAEIPEDAGGGGEGVDNIMRRIEEYNRESRRVSGRPAVERTGSPVFRADKKGTAEILEIIRRYNEESNEGS